jgi:hypothetical protein
MQPRPSFDRGFLIPIVISVVSILGIGWILVTSAFGESPAPPTMTPSRLSFFTARTLTPSPSELPTQEEAPPTPAETDPETYPGPPEETLTSTSTLTATPPTPSATYTPGGIQPLRAGKYDDTDPNIAYDNNWMALKNPSTASSYKGTIHASTDVGSEASFRFTGEGFRLGYKRGKSFGTVTVLIDDQPYGFHEQAFDLVWRSPTLSPGDHFVRIIHESGEAVNLDYIEILE